MDELSDRYYEKHTRKAPGSTSVGIILLSNTR